MRNSFAYLPKLPAASPFIFVVAVMFLQETVLSFVFPVIVNEVVANTAIVGLILSTSSMAGIIADFTLPYIFRGNQWRVQLVAAFIFSLPFIAILFLAQKYSLPYLFIVGCVIWGIYYELQAFAQHNYIATREDVDNHARIWGIVHSIWLLAGIIGSIIGGLLIVNTIENRLVVMIAIWSVGMCSSLALAVFQGGKFDIENVARGKRVMPWLQIVKNFLPVISISFCVQFCESSFWMLGALFTAELLPAQNADWLLLLIFLVPSSLMALFISYLKITTGKKRLAQIALLSAGIILLVMFIKPAIPLTLCAVFFFGTTFGMVAPLNDAVYSNLLVRLKFSDQELIGLGKAGGSLGYILGPLIMGLVAENLGYYNAFGFVGILCIVIAVMLLVTTRRKLNTAQINRLA